MLNKKYLDYSNIGNIANSEQIAGVVD